MSSQICLTLQKILSSNIISNTNKVEIQILSDSGFQHKISNRMVKNSVINLFGEKIFLPKTTNFILFEVLEIDQNKTRSRICAFSYQIDQVPIINKKRTIVGLDHNFNDFSLQFCIRMSLEVDTDTIHYTQQEFSEINPLQNLGKVGRNIIIPHKKDDNSKKSKIYSPKNQGSKKLIVDEMQNWDIKSEFSPSKNRFHLTNQMEEQYQLFQKQHTNESQSTQSQSIHERFQHNMKNGFGIDEHLEEYIEEKRTVKDCQLKLKENQAHKWQQLLKYKQFFLLGGMVGLLSAIFSTQLLLL